MAASKFDLISFLLLFGSFGWFALTYALELGHRRGPWSALVWTLFFWLLLIDAFGVLGGMLVPILRHTGIGWRFVALFVVLPYLLCAVRVRWLCTRRRAAALPSNQDPALPE